MPPAPHERESTAKCYMCQSWMCNLKTLLVKLTLLFTTCALIRDFLIKTIYTLRLRHPHLYKALVPLVCTVGTIINSRVKGYQPMWYDIANNINTTECLSYSLVVIPMQHNPQISATCVNRGGWTRSGYYEQNFPWGLPKKNSNASRISTWFIHWVIFVPNKQNLFV